MVYDKIDNLQQYLGLSEDIAAALHYLKNVDANIENGVYQINDNVKAIVCEYSTKLVNENDFEAHVEYLDIHFPVKGLEKISCTPLERTALKTEYAPENDIAFYTYQNSDTTNCVVGNGYFLLVYPQDAHMPQLCVGTPESIKKITIKIKI